jgi:D-alanyl-D-alanine carboxypeptidase (penicillin-binding protein 5/6)
MRLITVMLNTASARARADQTRTLLGWGFGNFEKATPLAADKPVATAKVRYGKEESVPAGLASPWTVTVPRAQKVETSVQLKPDLEAPVAKGAVVGKVVAERERQAVAEAPLVAQADVERAGFMLRAWQGGDGVVREVAAPPAPLLRRTPFVYKSPASRGFP